MKSSIRKSTYCAIYKFLDKVSPTKEDCGFLCNSICCTFSSENQPSIEGSFDLGIYLLPGEDKIFTKEEDWLHWTVEDSLDYDFPDSWHGNIYFIKCKNPPYCNRSMRPIQCRTYPVTPHLDQENNLTLILSTSETPYKCPLIEGNIKLEPSFLSATYTVWKHLLRDPLIYDLVKMDSMDREFIIPVHPNV